MIRIEQRKIKFLLFYIKQSQFSSVFNLRIHKNLKVFMLYNSIQLIDNLCDYFDKKYKIFIKNL